MGRFFGEVGYGNAVETPSGSGKWVDQIVEHQYYGDIIRSVSNLEVGDDKVNEDISVSNTISIVADQFANENFVKIKYIRWLGVPWNVNSVEVRAPRLILSLGGVYNGPTSQN